MMQNLLERFDYAKTLRDWNASAPFMSASQARLSQLTLEALDQLEPLAKALQVQLSLEPETASQPLGACGCGISEPSRPGER